MQVETETEGSFLVVRVLDKRLDASIAPAFRTELCKLIDGGQRAVVLDLANVRMIDSSGLGAVVSVFKHLGSGGRFRICGLQDGVRAVFKLTHMDRVFEIFDTRALAVAG